MKLTFHPKILAMGEDERREWAERTGRASLAKDSPKVKAKKSNKKEGGGE